MDKEEIEEITSRLDVLIRLTALNTGAGLTMTEKIHNLHKAGFRPVDIAEILSTTANVVNVRLSEFRKKKRRKT